jgi:hypothetical protein
MFWYIRKSISSLSKKVMGAACSEIELQLFIQRTGILAGLRIRIRIGSGFNRVSGSVSAFVIRIRIQKGKNDLQK